MQQPLSRGTVHTSNRDHLKIQNKGDRFLYWGLRVWSSAEQTFMFILFYFLFKK